MEPNRTVACGLMAYWFKRFGLGYGFFNSSVRLIIGFIKKI